MAVPDLGTLKAVFEDRLAFIPFAKVMDDDGGLADQQRLSLKNWPAA